jgi:GNAT superfamily N-acetyltransferase
VTGGGVVVRPATEGDLPRVVELFASEEGNELDQHPAPSLEPCYRDAFGAIQSDPNNTLVVAEVAGRVVGVLQLTIIQYVAYRGGRVALVEAVFVDQEYRRRGIGESLMRWAIDRAKDGGCFRIQLTSNKRRTAAHAFYARLGFEPSHEGFKLPLAEHARPPQSHTRASRG